MDAGGEDAGYSTWKRSKPGDESPGESYRVCCENKTVSDEQTTTIESGTGKG